MTGSKEGPVQPRVPDLRLRMEVELDHINDRLRALTDAKDRLQDLLNAVLTISRELELDAVLHHIVGAALHLAGARYAALGILHESRDYLQQLITAGLTEQESAALAKVEFPRNHGALGPLIRQPGALRIDNIGAHPASVGFPPGHPRMHTLLGVAISVRGEIYGDLYLSERHDGRPFDQEDQEIVAALACAAGIAIEHANLFAQVRNSAEHFQRLLLPTLPDLRPFTAAAVYRPATSPGRLGGDWYDAIMLPDHAVGLVIGDVVGHDLYAAAAMSQTRSMLRALLYDRRTPPSAILGQLDITLNATTENPVTTACLARVEPEDGGWTLHWSTAGHLPPLLIGRDRRAAYLLAEPGLPLGVDHAQHRPDHTIRLPSGATVVFFTDGFVEHPAHAIDEGLDAVLRLATAHAELPLDGFVQMLADHAPSDGKDDMAILALRTPDRP